MISCLEAGALDLAACPLVRCPLSKRSVNIAPTAASRRAMALAALSGDEQLVIFVQLCDVLDPGVAVAFGSTNSEL